MFYLTKGENDIPWQSDFAWLLTLSFIKVFVIKAMNVCGLVLLLYTHDRFDQLVPSRSYLQSHRK